MVDYSGSLIDLSSFGPFDPLPSNRSASMKAERPSTSTSDARITENCMFRSKSNGTDHAYNDYHNAVSE